MDFNCENLTQENIALLELILDSSSTESESDEEVMKLVREDESEDEIEMLLLNTKNKRNSIKNYMEQVFPKYDDGEFRQHYRIARSLFDCLTNKFEESVFYKNLRADKRLSACTYLAVFLWFAGHEACSFRDLSDRFNISISSVSRIINITTKFISSMSPSVIKWPNADRKIEISNFFNNMCGIPKAIGCIDGTHIVIDPPRGLKDDYVDRKGHVTICMQAICDEKKKFSNIFVGFPGSSHDSWVFQNSPVYQNLSVLCGEYYLLGDSAYPCSTHLITPYKDNGHLTSAQKNFNIKLSSVRVAVEHAFGLLKQRFRQLYYCKLRGAEKLCHFIRACCVLHNLANESDLDFEELLNNEDFRNQRSEETTRGNPLRDLICQNLHNKERI